MKKKILIVDDSTTARALFKVCMAGNTAYQIFETADANEAVKIALAEKPFLIILDYNMPVLEGPKIAKIMIDKGIQSKFVLMSANTQHSVIDEITKEGFVGVLEKPISAEAVQSLLEKLQ